MLALKNKQLQKPSYTDLCKNQVLAVDCLTFYLQGWTRCVIIPHAIFFSLAKMTARFPAKFLKSLFKVFTVLQWKGSRILKLVHLFQVYTGIIIKDIIPVANFDFLRLQLHSYIRSITGIRENTTFGTRSHCYFELSPFLKEENISRWKYSLLKATA